MRIFARADLSNRARDDGAPQLLLEGSWPAGEKCEGQRWSLDDSLDARHAWIDREAARLADVLAGRLGVATDLADGWTLADETSRWAYVNALALRYQLVKLIRVAAFFEQVRRPAPRESMEFFGQRGRDEVYASLLREISKRHGFARNERLAEEGNIVPADVPRNARWRRQLGAWTRHFGPAASSVDDARPRAVLCGNPRLLDPVCDELLRAGCRVWWLYDRWAARSWLRWAAAGVTQLVCDSSLGTTNRFDNLPSTGRLTCRGIDLARPLDLWMRQQAGLTGAWQTRMIQCLSDHFAAVRPNVVVVDEDATPLPRVAVAIGHRMGAQTAVVQHGAPCIRFGFAPLVADRVFAWGASSAQQLTAWGVSEQRIVVAGSPAQDRAVGRENRTAPQRKSVRVLLLATVPPRDDRPDALVYHLTTGTHNEMLQNVLAVMERLPDVELVIRTHPRTRNAGPFRELAARANARISGGGPLWREVRRATCVVSCASSAGVEAAAAGVPVIQLLPRGSGNVLTGNEWGFVGTARSADELEQLLRDVLARPRSGEGQTARVAVPSDHRSAAARIVEHLLEEYSTQVLGTEVSGVSESTLLGNDSCRANSESFESRASG